MLKRILVLSAIFLFSVGLCAAKTFTVKLHQPTEIAGQELKPGNYKVELTESTATLTNGRVKVETAIKQEQSDERFSTTSVRYTDDNGKMKIREIRVGGTNTKVVMN